MRKLLLLTFVTPLFAIYCYTGGVVTNCGDGIYCAISHQSINGITTDFQVCGNLGLGQTGDAICPEREYNPYRDGYSTVTCCTGDYCNGHNEVPKLPTDSSSMGTIFPSLLLSFVFVVKLLLC